MNIGVDVYLEKKLHKIRSCCNSIDTLIGLEIISICDKKLYLKGSIVLHNEKMPYLVPLNFCPVCGEKVEYEKQGENEKGHFNCCEKHAKIGMNN